MILQFLKLKKTTVFGKLRKKENILFSPHKVQYFFLHFPLWNIKIFQNVVFTKILCLSPFPKESALVRTTTTTTTMMISGAGGGDDDGESGDDDHGGGHDNMMMMFMTMMMMLSGGNDDDDGDGDDKWQ